MAILKCRQPKQLFSLFTVSNRSSRLVIPKFKKSRIKNENFLYNASRILNYLSDNDISYLVCSPEIFKKRLKQHLLNMQSISVNGDANWLPCNNNLFSDIVIGY